MDWFNEDLRREIYIGEKRASHSHFVMIDDDDDKNIMTKKGDTKLVDFEEKYNE